MGGANHLAQFISIPALSGATKRKDELLK